MNPLLLNRRFESVPVAEALVGQASIQNSLIGEPGADQLHANGHLVRAYTAGKRTAGQAEHTREAQKIRMIVACVMGIVAISFDSFGNWWGDSRSGRRHDEIGLLIRFM